MKLTTKINRWLDGKKTIIGLILSALITFLSSEQYINENMTLLLGTISGIIFAVGIGHKAKKNL